MASVLVSNSIFANNADIPVTVVPNSDGTSKVQVFTSGLSIPDHDYISLSYTGADLTGVIYKVGGSGGTTVGTLTLAYSGGNLASVTKS